jgi:hypothetical protein
MAAHLVWYRPRPYRAGTIAAPFPSPWPEGDQRITGKKDSLISLGITGSTRAADK